MARAGAAAVLALLVGCRSAPAPVPAGPPPATGRPPDLVLVTIDTVRADHVGPSYGWPRPTMPWLGEFSAGATVFADAVAPASWTLPTLVSLATGRPVAGHTVDRVERRLPPSVPTLAEELGAAGYQTAFFGVNPVLLVDRGPTRGFGTVWTDRGAAAGMVNQAVRRWLAEGRDPDQPLFLHVHYYDPHCPYRPPPAAVAALAGAALPPAPALPPALAEGAGCHAVRGPDGAVETALTAWHAAYDAELWSVDRALGALVGMLAAAGVDGGLAITSDHGESFGEHGIIGHSRSLWAPELQVPLVVRWPGQTTGRVERHRVGLVALPATLRAMALGGPDPLARVDADMDVLVETSAGPVPLVALYQGRRKLLAAGDAPVVAYALDSDPDEARPLPADSAPLEAARAAAAATAPAPVALEPDPAELELLRQLGYTL